MKLIYATTAIALLAAMPAFAGSPSAPDPIVVTPTPAPVVADRWDGFYAGAYAGSAYDDFEKMFGLLGGHNWQMGTVVFGVEIDSFSAESGDNEVFLNARAGAAIGDKALVFLKAGSGQYNGGLDLSSLGLGAEIAITDNISTRFDYEWHNIVGLDVTDGPAFSKLGLVWSF